MSGREPEDEPNADAPRTLSGLLLRGKPARRVEEAAADDAGQMNLLFSSAPQTEQPARSRVNEPRVNEEESAPPTLKAEAPRAAAAREWKIWTVRALVGDVRQSLEVAYDEVWVQGEVSNCRPAPSGHLYFTLKDGDAQLAVVMFRRQAQLMRFAVRDGMEVLARGRISMYEQRGQLQLIAETLEPRGAGSLQLAFEQLKAKLLAEGLFEQERKRPLPQFPQRVGVITSPAGAVVHDIIRVIRRRHACLDLLIYPAVVQGPECAGSVIDGLRWFNRAQSEGGAAAVDVIVIARGGGSLEDLAGFNDEALAREIAVSRLPVVSAVGHETDFTIADFVADLRAPTPSAAAELITAAQHRIEERVHGLAERLDRAVRYQMILRRQRYARLSAPEMLARVRQSIDRRGQVLDDARRRLDAAQAQRFEVAQRKSVELRQRLERHDPRVELLRARHRVESAERAMMPLVAARIARERGRVRQAEARLGALSPLGVLRRGYALVYSAAGHLLRDAAETAPGEVIRARFERGEISARVVEAEGEKK